MITIGHAFQAQHSVLTEAMGTMMGGHNEQASVRGGGGN